MITNNSGINLKTKKVGRAVIFLQVIKVLEKIGYSKGFMLGMLFLFFLLALSDIIGLSLLAPFINLILFEESFIYLGQVVSFFEYKKLSFQDEISIMSGSIFLVYLIKLLHNMLVLKLFFKTEKAIQANLKLLLLMNSETILLKCNLEISEKN